MKVLLLLTFLLSCAPSIQYLGDNYTPTSDVEFFYDEKDIVTDYKVMGIILNEASEHNDLEEVRLAMLEKSKSVGANAILFEAVNNERIGSGTHFSIHQDNSHSFFSALFGDDKKGVVIRAKLLKYK